MGRERPEREVTRARVAYTAAARRFVSAFARFVTLGVPLDTSSGREPPAWTHAHIAALLELHAALTEMIKTRRAYDQARRAE